MLFLGDPSAPGQVLSTSQPVVTLIARHCHSSNEEMEGFRTSPKVCQSFIISKLSPLICLTTPFLPCFTNWLGGSGLSWVVAYWRLDRLTSTYLKDDMFMLVSKWTGLPPCYHWWGIPPLTMGWELFQLWVLFPRVPRVALGYWGGKVRSREHMWPVRDYLWTIFEDSSKGERLWLSLFSDFSVETLES